MLVDGDVVGEVVVSVEDEVFGGAVVGADVAGVVAILDVEVVSHKIGGIQFPSLSNTVPSTHSHFGEHPYELPQFGVGSWHVAWQ